MSKTDEAELSLKRTLRELLKKRGLSEREFAKLIRMPPSTIGEWLSGSSPQDLLAIRRAAQLLGVSVSYLLFGTPESIGGQTLSLQELFLSEKVVSGLFQVTVKRLTPRLQQEKDGEDDE